GACAISGVCKKRKGVVVCRHCGSFCNQAAKNSRFCAILSLIFDRFYRTEVSRNRASGGSGLGLAICVNIVHAHNGHLHAAHSPFGGVSITVELPLDRDLQREV
ncbi:ATP-binding protein, partial [Salmonella enterica subsp. enterica serovar Lubbock]|nr:ATP-binding protein [Salmonella enterica subsp. enterica serovar Lubbock]